MICVKDEKDEIIGGLCGYFFESSSSSWAHVDYAWVNEKNRYQGIGTKLFEHVENLAKTKNCDHIQLFTWAYQAVGFYEKLGFERVGTISKWIDDYDAVFFRKQIR